MAAKKRKRTAPTPRAPRTPKAEPVDYQLHERRERVLELWGRPTRLIAKFLLEEGFPVNAGPAPVTKEKLAEWEKRRLELMRRIVDMDRAWWEAKWRERAKTPRTAEDLEVELESNVAAINSDVDEISQLMVDRDTKSTAKANLMTSKLRARELILKARGLDRSPEREPEDDIPVRPKILVYDISAASPELKAKYGLGRSE
jgi:hypothetical protein